jgi:signal transduction histidine kinase
VGLHLVRLEGCLPIAYAGSSVSTADELRRIERALHDGVQQDLVAVAVRLQLARRLAATDLSAALELLDEIENDVHVALDEVRTLANGIYPSTLDARGLPEALRGAAHEQNVTLTLEAEGIGRYPADIEAAAYFFCRAAFTDGARVTVQLHEEDGVLRVAAGSRGTMLPLVNPSPSDRG